MITFGQSQNDCNELSLTDIKYLTDSYLELKSIRVNLITLTEWYHYQWSHNSASTLLFGGIDLFLLINITICFLQQTPTKIGTTTSGRRFTGTSRSTESRFAWSGASPASSTGRQGVPTVQSATTASRWVNFKIVKPGSSLEINRLC